MKISFEEGKLKELVYQNKNNKKWEELSHKLNVPIHVIKGWASERNLISKEAYELLDPRKRFYKYITEIKQDNWGRIKGGKLSSGRVTTILKPKKNEKLAELVGIILGDGNISVIERDKSKSYVIRIVGDERKDKKYLIDYVKPLCEELFNIKVKTHKHKQFNALYLTINSKQAVEFLISVGLKKGNKIENQLTIPSWIFEQERLLKACLRGLVDTDGSIYELKPQWPGIWQICFTNRNNKLLEDFKRGLQIVGIDCSKISKRGNTPQVYITKKEAVGKFYKEIGFANIKHKNKIAPSSSGLIPLKKEV